MTHPELRQSLDFNYKLIHRALASVVSNATSLYGKAESQSQRDELELLRLEAFQAQRAIQAVQDTFAERT